MGWPTGATCKCKYNRNLTTEHAMMCPSADLYADGLKTRTQAALAPVTVLAIDAEVGSVRLRWCRTPTEAWA